MDQIGHKAHRMKGRRYVAPHPQAVSDDEGIIVGTFITVGSGKGGLWRGSGAARFLATPPQQRTADSTGDEHVWAMAEAAETSQA